MPRTTKYRSRLNLNRLEQRDVPSTTLVKDINAPAFFNSYPGRGAASSSGEYYFVATDVEHGREIWITDGTPAGTRLAADVNPGAADSDPANLTMLNGSLYFTADGGNGHGVELWKLGNNDAATEVRDINAGAASSSPDNLIVMNGSLFFTATTAASGEELWKTNGTNAGTQLVKDIEPGAGGSIPNSLVVMGGKLYFAASTVVGDALWTSDGSAAGTTMVKDIWPGNSNLSFIDELTVIGNKLYLAANDGVHGKELWISDGTANGTTLVKDINPGTDASALQHFAAFNGVLYFSAFSAGNGYELWKSDGTAGGTTMVADINPGVFNAAPNDLTVAGNSLFFYANDGAHGYELWKTDGTAAGTALVKDIRLGASDSQFSSLRDANGTLYFVRGDNFASEELWKSDGTTAGTTLVKDFAQTGGAVTTIGEVNGTLYLSAQGSAAQGRELWMTTSVHRAESYVIGADAGQLPQVRVYDKDTQAVALNLFAYDPSFKGGVRVACGDVTGDGVPDVVTAAGSGGGPHVRVFDGVTGGLKKEFFAYAPNFAGGVFIASGDFNNDGYADIVTGAGAGGGPHVKVFNGKTLGLITEFFAFNAAFTGGVNVGTGDVNADGFFDLIFAAGPGGGPHVRVISGKDNTTELRSFFAYDAAFNGGVNIAAGDLNGDGYDDLIVSQASKGQRIHTYNGKDNALLKDFDAIGGAYAGGVRVASADIDHDGFAELLSATPNQSNDKILVLSRSAGSPNTFVGGLSINDPAFLGGVFVGV